jgi:hypothetical protein
MTQEGLFFSHNRLMHVHNHQFQLQSRVNTPHGVWANDDEGRYGNQTMLILSHGDRALRRIKNNSGHVKNTNPQHNGRIAYDVQLSTTDDIGTANMLNAHGGVHAIFVSHARLVIEPVVNHNGFNAYPVVTFFPINY